MAMAVNDILMLTDVQQYLSQTMLNVYFYRLDVIGSALAYSDVADYFQTQVTLEIAGLQMTTCTHTNLIIKNLTNGLDIYEDVTVIAGENNEDQAPSFLAASFRLIRSTAATRHGSKRIGGLSDQFSIGNNLNASYNAAVAAAATALGSPVFVDSAGDLDLTMTPVIIGRYPQEHVNAGEIDLSVVNPVSSAQFIRVSTQTTRRAGRGV